MNAERLNAFRSAAISSGKSERALVSRHALADLLRERNELRMALEAMTRTFLNGTHYETQNPYTRQVVRDALMVIAKADDKSTFGNDWMDAIEHDPLDRKAAA